MEWWLWIVLGCGLLALEVLTPGGFFFLFFGIGAILTGAVTATGLLDADWLQWLSFSVLSVVFLVFLRKMLVGTLGKNSDSSANIDGLVGLAGVAISRMAGNEPGQVELRGSNWNARNVSVDHIAVGQRCRVERVEGITLIVRGEH